MTQTAKPDIWGIALTQEQVAKAAAWLADQSRTRFTEELQNQIADRLLESPLEATFLAWWEAVDRLEAAGSDISVRLSLLNQHRVKVGDREYRADFVISVGDTDFSYEAHVAGYHYPLILVELDGHDYHERTKAQVIDRDQRDRALLAAGWRIFHFSGSELVRNPERCVREVRDLAEEALWELHRAMNRRRFDAERAATPLP